MVVQPFEVGNCLTARMHKGINSTLDEGQTPVLHPVAIQGNLIGREVGGPQGVGASDSGVMYTLTKTDVHGVAQPIPFDTTQITSPSNYSRPQAGDPCHPLAAGAHPPAVAQPMVLMDQGGSVMNVEHDMVGTLRRETHGHEPVVMQPVAFQQTADCLTAAYGTKWNGNASATNGSLFAAQPIGFDSYNHAVTGDVSKTLDVGQDYHHVPNLFQNMAVRRLTPVECERLQGFPDGYTNIPWRKKDESPDGPRYKALGNSWAVPVVRWIGERIAKAA
jgi:DNA (cytosine-5)-methyltransferase 1